MKLYSIISILVFTFFNSVQISRADEELHKKCMLPSVKIVAIDNTKSGSGTIIRSEKHDNVYRNVALTSRHIFNDDELIIDVVVFKYDESCNNFSAVKYRGITFAQSKLEDFMAILFVSDVEMPCATIGSADKIKIGEKVVKIGYATKARPRAISGQLTWNENNILSYDATTIPGDSGGGLFHENKLIGVVKHYDVFDSGDGPKDVFSNGGAVSIEIIKSDKDFDSVINTNNKLPHLPYSILEGFLRYKLSRE